MKPYLDSVVADRLSASQAGRPSGFIPLLAVNCGFGRLRGALSLQIASGAWLTVPAGPEGKITISSSPWKLSTSRTAPTRPLPQLHTKLAAKRKLSRVFVSPSQFATCGLECWFQEIPGQIANNLILSTCVLQEKGY